MAVRDVVGEVRESGVLVEVVQVTDVVEFVTDPVVGPVLRPRVGDGPCAVVDGEIRAGPVPGVVAGPERAERSVTGVVNSVAIGVGPLRGGTGLLRAGEVAGQVLHRGLVPVAGIRRWRGRGVAGGPEGRIP